MAAILAYVATTRDAVYGFALLSTYAVGFGVPFWALAGFSMSLPRSGAWMDAVKSVFGIALLVAALYYLKNVVPALGQLTGRTPLFLLGALAAAAVGVALGAVHLTFHDTGVARLRKAGGVALATVGLFAVTNYVLTPKGPVELTWMRDEGDAVTAARVSGQPLLIDFMADWCLPCRELDLKVFSQPDVARALHDDFTLLRVDLTREDENPALGVVKKKYAADTLPAVRIVSPAGAVLARTDEVLTPARFLDLLRTARGPN